MQEVLTVKQLADYLQVNELTIYKKVKEGLIPAVKLGRALRFKKSVIDKWLEVESGWDYEFERLLKETQAFGREKGITEKDIEEAIMKVRTENREGSH